MKSLNQIIAELEAFANVHYQIHTFGHGDVWEATPNSSQIVYPILWLVPTGATTGLREVTTNFTVICMDLVRSGEENETEVLSDTLQIILDVVSYYRQQHNQTYIVEFGSNIQPFTESHPDMLAGHSITVSIRQPFTYNECAIPFSGAPTPLVPTCAAATIQNAASNPTYQASIESGGNLVLPQVKVLDSDGVTDILANYIPNADGYVAECSVPTCADATVTNQAEDYSLSIASGATEKLPFGKVKNKEGADVQVDYIPASQGYIYEALADELREDYQPHPALPYTFFSYIGVAPNGSSESADVWYISRILINPNGTTSTQTATDVAWTDRLTVIYT